MQGAQNKKKTPGAFKSCLVPYRKQVFTWWFDERLPATEIQKRLLEKYGIEIHSTSITRFIKVRRNKPDPHERPPHLQIPETSPAPPRPKTTKQMKTAPSGKVSAEEAEAEAMLKELGNSTQQEFSRKVYEAEKKKRQT